MNIGERLEEARKRKGISLREAAEAIKIRTDFLAAFEKDDFGFNLPDVYKQGFLRTYAKYLGIDDNQIVIDYQAKMQTLSRSNFLKKDIKEEEGQTTGTPQRQKVLGKSFALFKENKNAQLKIGIGLVVVLFILFIGIFAFTRGGSNENKPREITIQSTSSIGLAIFKYDSPTATGVRAYYGFLDPNAPAQSNSPTQSSKNQSFTLTQGQFLEIECGKPEYFSAIKIQENGKDIAIDKAKIEGTKYRIQ